MATSKPIGIKILSTSLQNLVKTFYRAEGAVVLYDGGDFNISTGLKYLIFFYRS